MSLARHYTTVGAATLLSRLTGFVRDVMIAAVLGSSAVADAYIAAFLLPNLFRRVLSEGAFNAAFVPIYARRAATGGAESVQAFIESAFSTLVALVCVAVVASELLMPVLIAAVAPGFASEPGKFADAVLFGRLAFIFVGAIVVSALIASILNAIGRFSLVALAPLALNFMLIVVLAVLLALGWRERREAGLAMVLTVLVAGVAQLLIVGWGLRRAGLSLRWRRPSFGGDVRMLMLRILPGLMLAGAGHFNMVVAAQMSSSLPSAVSWLYYADRLFQLPLGFVAAAIGTVLLPEVSRALSAADHEGARAAGGRAIEFGFMLVLPAALSLVVLADPIVTVIYRHGAFSFADATATAEVLRALAIALPGFVLVKALLPPYLARENIRAPLVAALAGVVVNIVVTLSLVGSLGHVAAPLGVAASAFVNAAVLAAGLRGTGDLPFDAMSRRNLVAIALASVATAGVAFLLRSVFAGALDPPAPFALRAATLAAICVAGVAVHAACLFALGITDRSRILAAFRRPAATGGPPPTT